MMDREKITKKEIERGFFDLRRALKSRLEEHGDHALASRHEIMGIIQTEKHELEDAIEHGTVHDVMHELLDVTVPALFGYICMRAGKVDW
jgi:hypothetical protein